MVNVCAYCEFFDACDHSEECCDVILAAGIEAERREYYEAYWSYINEFYND